MTTFDIKIGDKKYKISYDRNAARAFEKIGGTMTILKEKFFTATDMLMFVGLSKYHPTISLNEAMELSDKAIDEHGINTVYSTLAEAYMSVFTQGGSNATEKKTGFIVESPKAV